MKARDIMTTDVVTINPAASVRHAVALMVSKNISGLPVVDDAGQVCGMLTEGDLMTRREVRGGVRPAAGRDADPLALAGRFVKDNSWSVGDVMSADVVSSGPDSEVSGLAQTMGDRGIKRVPIVENGRLVGIVSRHDVLRSVLDATQDVVAAGDEAMQLAISTRLRDDLAIGDGDIVVTVRQGQVILEGEIASDIQRKAVRGLVVGIGGAGGYVDRLEVRPDKNSAQALKA